MDWIKLPVRIRDDPRVGILAEKLGISYHEALGRLVHVMTWCGDHETRILPASVDGVTRDALRVAGLLGAEGLADYEFTSSSLATSRESNRLRQQKHRRKLKQLKGSVTVTSQKQITSRNGLDLDLEGEGDLDLEREKEPSPPLSPSRGKSKRWKVVPAEHRTMTEAQREYATRYGVSLDEWAAFIDHQYRTPKSDVDASWQTWVRNAAARAPRLPLPTPKSAVDVEAAKAHHRAKGHLSDWGGCSDPICKEGFRAGTLARAGARS